MCMCEYICQARRCSGEECLSTPDPEVRAKCMFLHAAPHTACPMQYRGTSPTPPRTLSMGLR